MIRILVSDKLAEEGLEMLNAQRDVQVDVKTGLNVEELKGILGEYDGLIIRSGTKVTAEVLENPGRLRAIARAGVGVDNVDVPTATRKGIVVMNTPDGNTISTAEQTIGLLCAVARHTVKACGSLKSGEWNRSAFMGRQLSGRRLGVIGLGRIGRAVAERALALGMQVLGYDPYFVPSEASFKGRVEIMDDLNELCRRSDYVTVHTTMTDQTRGLISREQFEVMREGTAVINCARGGIIDEDALLEALTSGKIAAAALDVYTQEPPANRKLIEHPNVVCTPHLGASTKEAQVLVAVDAAKQIVKALTTGEVINAVNAPGYDASLEKTLQPYASLGRRMGTVLAQTTGGRIRKLRIEYSGEIAEMTTTAVTVSLLVGLLQDQTEEPVNSVNAQLLARDRGIDVEEVKRHAAGDFKSLISATLETDKASRSLAGTIFSQSLPRIVGIDDYQTEIVPAGRMMITFNDDKPGVIGEVGTLFGQCGINIASLTFARKSETHTAAMILTLDSEPSKEVLDEVGVLPFMHSVHFIHLPELEEQGA